MRVPRLIETAIGRVGKRLAELTELNEAIKGDAADNFNNCWPARSTD